MKKTIAVLMGGNSSEYEVSLNSGKQVFESLDRDKYDIYPILLRGSEWCVLDDNHRHEINKDNFSFKLMGKEIKFDCVFIVIHGTPGEDGRIQGYFDMLKIPYSSCDLLTSALTFNKNVCKNYLKNFDIKMAKSLTIKKHDSIDPYHIVNELDLPVFIKPNNGGSSCGTSKVKSVDEIEKAIRTALKEDAEVIIEQFIEGTEVTNGVICVRHQQLILPITEVISKNDFFDYEAKYNANKATEITPARLSDELTEKCKAISAKICSVLNCKGIVRIDYILKDNEFYFLEINTIPGMTKTSFIPQQIKAHGLNLKDVYTTIIEDAMTR